MSSQSELSVSYGLPQDFFALWLDKGLNYSSAVFHTGEETLEEAQQNKLDYFYEGTKTTPASRVLDIGCGWGGNLRYLARTRGVKDATGITLSKEQYEFINREFAGEVTMECVSYADYEPQAPFDTIISIGMFEHLSTPEQVRSGEQIGIYRDYFKRAWSWTKEGSYFGLQSVIGCQMPRAPELIRELGWATNAIFPGAISPRLEAIVASMNPYWEVQEVKTRRAHYGRTSALWRQRLNENEAVIRERWGSDVFETYDRYLKACVTMFGGGYQSLAQLILKRVERKSRQN